MNLPFKLLVLVVLSATVAGCNCSDEAAEEPKFVAVIFRIGYEELRDTIKPPPDPDDPFNFATDAPTREQLAWKGVDWPEGTTANYSHGESELIIRGTENAIKQIERLLNVRAEIIP